MTAIDEETAKNDEQKHVANRIELNDTVALHIPELLQTKLLIQANSGGGKTYLIRRVLEQSHGQLQHIVIDIEGGLRTLREKYEYVILGEPSTGADFPITPENAGNLALMFLQFRTSIILHLGGYSPSMRQEIVKNFLEALLVAPQELWHPTLVVIDEAHVFCPQLGVAVASDAVKDLCARGRYRAYCPIVATQRVTKLHNDVLAECNNKFFGRTTLPDDLIRSNEQLNFARKSKVLEHVAPGTFYGYGPAVLPKHTVQEVLIGDVVTTHPTPGTQIDILQPPESMTKVLEALRDMLAPSHEEIKTKERKPKTQTTNTAIIPVTQDEDAQITSLMERNERQKKVIEGQAARIQALLSVTTSEQQLQAERLWTASINIEHAVIHQLNAGVSTQENIQEKKELAIHVSPEPPKVNEAKFRRFKERFDAIPAKEKKVLSVLVEHTGKWLSIQDLALWLQVVEKNFTSHYTPSTLLKWNIITRRPGNRTFYTSRFAEYLQQEFPETGNVAELIQRLLPS